MNTQKGACIDLLNSLNISYLYKTWIIRNFMLVDNPGFYIMKETAVWRKPFSQAGATGALNLLQGGKNEEH